MHLTKRILLPLLLLSFIILAVTGLWLTDYLFAVRQFEWHRYFLRNSPLLLSLFPLWFLVVRFSFGRIIGNVFTAVAATLTILLLAEVVFSFVSLSTGGGYSLVSKNWFAQNWHENKLGFRDEEPLTKDRKNMPNLLVIGDSYTAGHGITDTAERFTNLLGKALAPCCDVFNVARCGAGTKDEFDLLQHFPIKPDVVMLLHVPNDISEVVNKKLLNLRLREKGGFASMKLLKYRIGFLYKHSFLYNFLMLVLEERNRETYYHYIMEQYGSPKKFLQSDEGLMMTDLAYYANDSLLNLHLKNLQLFVNYAAEQKVKLMVAVLPRTNDKLLEISDDLANRSVAGFFEEQQIPVLNLTSVLKLIPEKERQISAYDPHTSTIANREMARKMLHFLLQNDTSMQACSTFNK